MSISATIQGLLQISDSSTGASPSNDALDLATSGTALTRLNTLTIGTSPTTIALPISPVNFVFIQNLNGVNTVTVTWTPNGGVSAVVQTLEPLAWIAFGQTQGGGGITALSVVASLASTAITYTLLG